MLPLFVVALERFLTSHRLVHAFAPALVLLGVLATSDIVGPLTVLVGAIYFITRYAMMARRHEGNSVRNVAIAIGLSLVVALPLAPTYLALAPGLAGTEQTKLATHPSLLDAVGAFNAITFDLPWFWAVGLLVAILSPLAPGTRSHRLAVLCLAILVPSVVLLIWVGESRFVYFVPLSIVIGLGAWWGQSPRLLSWSRPALDAAIIAFLVIDVLVGTQYFASQRNYYTVLTPGVVQGLSELRADSQPDQIIAVSPAANDWEVGWWVEGIARRHTVYAGDPIWLTYADERTRNALANRIYGQDTDVAESARRARDAGVAYLFVDKDWEGYKAWNNGRNINPKSILFENQAVLIIASGI